MQVCTSPQTDNHANTSPLSFYRPDALPAAQPTASKHWRHYDDDDNVRNNSSYVLNCYDEVQKLLGRSDEVFNIGTVGCRLIFLRWRVVTEVKCYFRHYVVALYTKIHCIVIFIARDLFVWLRHWIHARLATNALLSQITLHNKVLAARTVMGLSCRCLAADRENQTHICPPRPISSNFQFCLFFSSYFLCKNFSCHNRLANSVLCSPPSNVLTGTCRQCGSWSVAGHSHRKVIGRDTICAS